MRTGYVTTVALRFGVGLLRGVLYYLLDEMNHPRLERMMGKPLAEIIVTFGAVEEWLVELSEEADRRLKRARPQ